MADDRGLEGPEDSRLVETPAGLTPLEVRAGEEARRKMLQHLGNRPNLRMDELAEMTDLRPRLETPGGIKLPDDTRGNKNRIWFFSVDGTLRGNRFKGCLMAGECIMVQAKSFEEANRIARDGLNDTPEIARDYFAALQESVVVSSPLDHSHMQVDAGGRRASNLPPQPDLATDPKLKAMIRHIIGGERWKG